MRFSWKYVKKSKHVSSSEHPSEGFFFCVLLFSLFPAHCQLNFLKGCPQRGLLFTSADQGTRAHSERQACTFGIKPPCFLIWSPHAFNTTKRDSNTCKLTERQLVCYKEAADGGRNETEHHPVVCSHHHSFLILAVTSKAGLPDTSPRSDRFT